MKRLCALLFVFVGILGGVCAQDISTFTLPTPWSGEALRADVPLGEFGGKGLFVRGRMWPVRNDAYEMMTSHHQLTDTYVYLLTEVE